MKPPGLQNRLGAHAGLPLWPLPLAITMVFLVAVHLAYALSIRDGWVEACVPYLEGCVSISRAARHGVGNQVFRWLVIPCAALHVVVWWLAARWFAAPSSRVVTTMRWLGTVSACALAVYAFFLGTQGEVYGFLRRYGVTVYFGFGFLAQLLLLRVAARRHAIGVTLRRWMAVICVWMLLLGVANVIAGLALVDEVLRDRVENALEWQLGLLLVGWFALLALAWKQAALRWHSIAIRDAGGGRD
ncbi:hypothetical protein [Pseudoxanthomonas indica]|uniref:Frag1/DRAM/Sfk1 family protein n=1 Tax=Pseudoxanthomonas indica TaxID=428993 RepID=A0A1T5IPR0_9GAMM|nr:hypothetical protein [Pseudoxanthomonas indica]GGD53559.1 hypothetical protein GCM10007235_27260 [Pseudoxanthomonas indica]SKC41147.1 hypothetical protein SAMN06296058_0143 [Pseudoxanthomonas indica]